MNAALIARPQTPPQPAPTQPAPWSAIQRDPSNLAPAGEDRVHIDGVRWGIASDEHGTLIEQGKFNDAYLSPNHIQEVFLCIKPFADQPRRLPGHALLQFQFDPQHPVTNSDGGTDSSLMISVEAHMHQGEKWGPDTKNPIVYQLGTWGDAVQKLTYDQDPLERYKLLLTPEQKTALLNDRLNIGVQNHSADQYDAATNNCLTSIIKGVNKLLPEERQIPFTLPDGSLDPSATIPMWSPSAFANHGLITRDKPDVSPVPPKPNPTP